MRLKTIGPNAHTVEAGDITVLFSYATPVAAHIAGEGYCRTTTRHSVTTSRHVNAFLDGFKATERDQEWFDVLGFDTQQAAS